MVSSKKNPIDAHIGARLRAKRLILGLTQEKLGECIGVTFQQVQKYEKGDNRISASRLFRFAHCLNEKIDYFFDGMTDEEFSGSNPFLAEATDQYTLESSQIYTNKEIVNLVKIFSSINDANVRKKVINLVAALAESSS